MNCEKCGKEMKHIARGYYVCEYSERPVTSDLSREEKIKIIYEVIMGSIVQECCMIGDVLDWIESNNIEEKQHEKIKQRKSEGTQYTYTPVISMILALYKEKRKPLEEQSEYLVDYIYSLIK